MLSVIMLNYQTKNCRSGKCRSGKIEGANLEGTTPELNDPFPVLFLDGDGHLPSPLPTVLQNVFYPSRRRRHGVTQ